MPSEAQGKLVKELERDLAGLRARDQLRSLAQITGVNLVRMITWDWRMTRG
jgi:hypothetical protein